MRITTSMVQRNVLADLNSLSSQLAKTQAKAASNKEITRPSDDPFKASQAMGLRSSIGANEQYVRNDPGRHRLDGLDRVGAGLDLGLRRPRAHARAAGRDRHLRRRRRARRSPPSSTQIIEGIKQSANASYGGKYIMAGTAIETPPYQLGANDAYQGDEAGLDPAIPGIVREIGPGVTMTINTRRARVPRRRPGRRRRQAAAHAARRRRPPQRRRRRRAARRRHRRCRATSTSCSASAPATARRRTASRRRRRAWTRSASRSRRSSRTPRTPTSRRR